LLKGHFELRSGLHSDLYFQCANVLRYPRLAARLCAALVDRVREAAPEVVKVDAVMSPALGGIIVGHEIARVLAVRSLFAEKADGKLVLRRFAVERGERFLVAEDVVTRGGRVQETVELVERAGGRVTGIAVLVDRSGGKAQFAHPFFSLLELAPVTWEPGDCPLCREGVPPVHPGS